jgi:hypothetical protein
MRGFDSAGKLEYPGKLVLFNWFITRQAQLALLIFRRSTVRFDNFMQHVSLRQLLPVSGDERRHHCNLVQGPPPCHSAISKTAFE